MFAHLLDVKTSIQKTLENCDSIIAPMIQQNSPIWASRLVSTWQFLPETLRYKVIIQAMNHFFKEAFNDGELEHLAGRSISLKLKETDVIYHFMIGEHKFEQHDKQGESCVSATLKSFIGLASKEVDPDALFFNRELIMEGDTDLALEVKHLIDNIEIPSFLKAGLKKLSELL
jgi:O2-independent ubiquinone biosynthesis accessory factor UbiT